MPVVDFFKCNAWSWAAGIITFLLSMWFFFEQATVITALNTAISLITALIVAFFANIIQSFGEY